MINFLRHPPSAGAEVLREQNCDDQTPPSHRQGANSGYAGGIPPGGTLSGQSAATVGATAAIVHEPRRQKRRGRSHRDNSQVAAIWSAEEDEDDRPSWNDDRRSSAGDLRALEAFQEPSYIPRQYTTQQRHRRDPYIKLQEQPPKYQPVQQQSSSQSDQEVQRKQQHFQQQQQLLQKEHKMQENSLKKQHRMEAEILYRQQLQKEKELFRMQQQELQSTMTRINSRQNGSQQQPQQQPQQQQPRPQPKSPQYSENPPRVSANSGPRGMYESPHQGAPHVANQSQNRGTSRTQQAQNPNPSPSRPVPHMKNQTMTDGGGYLHPTGPSGGGRRVQRPSMSSPSVVGTDINQASVFSMRTATNISFRSIEYTVKQRRWPWSKPQKKQVLQGASGIMRPGLNAIMGPTGSGKSSLLDVLAGRKDPQYLSGEVLVNGAPQPANFKCMSGYVVQDDIVIGELTVRENLWFSASLRLPSRWTRKDRLRKVEDVIEELGLTKVADSKIGTELIRGVSGGERKRTNIGMELITDPSVLFLDEPTTGLDAFTAGSVVKTLKNLGIRGRTVILSIHQPKYSIYKLFDTLTLVLNGHIIYHGAGDDAPLQYFRKIGYEIEDRNSPPDFFMDLMHGEVYQNPGALKHTSTNMAYVGDSVSCAGIDAEILPIEDDYSRLNIATNLMKSWVSSSENQRLIEELEFMNIDSCSNSFNSNNGEMGPTQVGRRNPRRTVSYPTSFAKQLVYVTWRSGLSLLRNPIASVVQLAVYFFFGMSIGIVYFGLDKSLEAGIQNRVGLFFFLTIQTVFVNMGSCEIFIRERAAFIHENSSGFYRVSVYFLAKIIVDMLPLKALPVFIFMPIVYWMAGLKPDAGAFFFYELALILATSAACGIAYFVSATFSIFGIATLVISMIYVFMMVFGGFLINIKSMGAWINWCRYLSIFRYCIGSLTSNEFNGLEFCSSNVTIPCKAGTKYLNEQDINHGSDWDLWSNILGLSLITIFFCALAYLQLRRINKYK